MCLLGGLGREKRELKKRNEQDWIGLSWAGLDWTGRAPAELQGAGPSRGFLTLPTMRSNCSRSRTSVGLGGERGRRRMEANIGQEGQSRMA